VRFKSETTILSGCAATVWRGTGAPAARRLRSARMQLSEFQALMDQLYGSQDRERGMAATVAWLCEEVGELAQAVRKGTPDQQLHELGDVLAWLASLANQLGLSLEDAAERYRDDPPL
jgi:NTP pyrophosphatase (non-canonical NTP hydrolase)